MDRNEWGTNPGIVQAQGIRDLWYGDLFAGIVANILIQTDAGRLFDTPHYDFAADTVSSSAVNLAAIDELEAAATALPDTAARHDFWVGVAAIFAYYRASGGDTVDTGYAYLSGATLAYLDAAIQASDAALSWDSISYAFENPEGETITGTGGDDSALVDTIYSGTFEADTIIGLGGADYLQGGAGNDVIYGHSADGVGDDGAADDLWGEDGDDVLHGGAGDDILRAGDGNDHLLGGAGNDTLYSGSQGQQSLLEGGSGDDWYRIGFSTTGTNTHYVQDSDGIDTVMMSDVNSFGQLQLTRLGNTGLRLHHSSGSVSTTAVLTNQLQDPTFSQAVEYLEFHPDGNANNAITFDLIDYLNNFTGEMRTDGTENGEVINGITIGSQKDEIYAGGGDDIVFGDAGDDTLYGQGGNDTIHGGLGNDYIDSGDGDNTVYGDEGNDTILGGGGHDVLNGGAGDDEIQGGGGNDLIHAGTGNDSIRGGSGYDVLILPGGVAPGDVTFTRDYGVNFSGTSMLMSLPGNNSIVIEGQFRAGNSAVGGDPGIEEIRFSDGTVIDPNALTYEVHGTPGDDDIEGVVQGGGFNEVIYGYGGNDFIDGWHGDDIIYGGDGDDELWGRGGDSILYGEAGNDLLKGIAGSNILDGGAGDDTLQGAHGNDNFIVSSGNDAIEPDTGGTQTLLFQDGVTLADLSFEKGTGNNLTVTHPTGTVLVKGHFAGNGIDIFRFSDGTEINPGNLDIQLGAINGTENDDTILGVDAYWGNKDDVIYAHGGNDEVLAGDGDDFVDGGAGNDEISTGSGTNTVYGGDGDDRIFDGVGNDTIDAGAGDDYVYAGAGGDNVIYSGIGHDTIQGGAGNDKLVLPTGITLNDIEFARDYSLDLFGRKLLMTLPDGSTITSENQFYSPGITFTPKRLEELELDGGTITGFGAIEFVSHGTSGNDNMDGIQEGGSRKDIFYGYEGNDFIEGWDEDDILHGGAGDDTLEGDHGNDILDGGEGNDGMDGGPGTDTLDYSAVTAGVVVNLLASAWTYDGTNTIGGNTAYDGTGGIDSLSNIENITGSAYGDYLSGSDSVGSVLSGGGGDDVIYGRAHADILIGGAGDDTIDGGDGIDTVDYSSAAAGVAVNLVNNIASDDGDGGTDTLINIENITGSAYADTLIGHFGDNIIDGGAGNDVIYGYYGNDTLYGGEGDDDLRGQDGIDTYYGGNGNDFILGGVGHTAYGEDGDDVIRGYGGTGLFDGGDGTDKAWWRDYQHAGNIGMTIDLVAGTATDGDGMIATLAGIENVTGSVYADVIHGDDTVNTIRGGSDAFGLTDGNDMIYGYGGDDLLHGDNGDDTLFGGEGDDQLWGLNDNDTLYGEAGADGLYGYYGDDTLEGGAGNDTLYGQDGDDILLGGDGDDYLNGGRGDDSMTGGAGADRFVFESLDEITANTDHITDFEEQDIIDLSAIAAGLSFIGDSTFSGTAGEMRYGHENGTTAIEIDSTGDGVRDHRIVLDNGEFVIDMADPQTGEITGGIAPPPDHYTIFERQIGGQTFTVELDAQDAPLYSVDDVLTTDQDINEFVKEAGLAGGGQLNKTGNLNENTLEYYGTSQNPSISIVGTDSDQVKISGSGVGGSYKFGFADTNAADAFSEFAKDLLGKDPNATQLFNISTGTNGGANTFKGYRNDEIVSLNEGADTPQSFTFTASGESVSGTEKYTNFDSFIESAAILFDGQQIVDGLISNDFDTPDFVEFDLVDGPDANGLLDVVEFGPAGTQGQESWQFTSEQNALNFYNFVDQVV